LSLQSDVTRFTTLLSVFYVLLYSHTRERDLWVGSPIVGRSSIETGSLIGFFANTVVLRAELSEQITFRQLLRRTFETIQHAKSHWDLPFDKIVGIVRPPRDLSRNPLFQVNFRMLKAPPQPLQLSRVETTTPIWVENGTAKFDAALELNATQGVSGFWEYNTDLFEEKSIARLARDFEQLLRELIAEPEVPLQQINAVMKIQQGYKAGVTDYT
jgi:non-ribosomal peptide synthetase component F